MQTSPTRSLATVLLLLMASAYGSPRFVRAGEEESDPTLERAAEHLLAGRPDEAKKLVDAYPAERRKAPPGTKPWTGEGKAAGQRDLQWRLLHAVLEPTADDPFELVAALVLASDSGWGSSYPVAEMPWFEVFARYAIREGYPDAAVYLLGRWQERTDRGWHEDLARLIASLPTRPSSAGGAAPDVVTRALARRLEMPRRQPYAVVPLAPTFEPLVLDEEKERERADEALRGFVFPETFHAIRAEVKGKEAVAIGASQDYDPVGEVSEGAYWVIRSHDAGATWERSLYTGLRAYASYVVRAVSNAPLLDGDHLQIEVRLAEIDPESITFPPIGTRLKREKKDLLVRVAFADLERDGDADGLTDLAEERLLTDPENPDSDGDGIPDGRDPLPLVPFTAGSDEAARALGAVLKQTTGVEPDAIIVRPGGGEPSDEEITERARRAVLSSEHTYFLRGERRAFAPLSPSRRFVVITEPELVLVRKKFGTTYPYEFSFFFLDHEKRRAVVVWNACWVGGTLRLDRSEEGWVVKVLGRWIT